jgi:predicted MPP superfamily phosphohydrolase
MNINTTIKNLSLFLIYLTLFANFSKGKILKILFITDIHLNPLYTSKEDFSKKACVNENNIFDFLLEKNDYGKYGCDTNLNLLDSLLDDIIITKNNFDLILIGGDSLFHTKPKLLEKYENFNLIDEAKNIFKTIKEKFDKKLNNTNILYIMGNNDLIEKYNLPEKDLFEKQVNSINKIFMLENFEKNKEKFNEDFTETLKKGFFYTYNLNTETKFVIINSVLFSSKNDNIDIDNEKNIAFEQLNWIENQMKLAKDKNQKVILMDHIPPFLNYYENKDELLLKEIYLNKFSEILDKYRDYILYYFNAHCHLPKIGIRVLLKKNEKEITCSNKKKNNFLKDNIDKEKIYKFSEFKNNKNNKTKENNNGLFADFYLSSILFPSLSPVYNNNPGYSWIEFDDEENTINNIYSKFFDLKESNRFNNYIKEKNRNKKSNKNINNNKDEVEVENEDIQRDVIIKDYLKLIKSENKFPYDEILNFNELNENKYSFNELNYRRILLKSLWGIKYSYKKNFGFKSFYPEDFSNFIFSDLYKQNYLENFVTYRLGWQKENYHEAKEILISLGQFDQENNLRNFRKGLYKFKNEDCTIEK